MLSPALVCLAGLATSSCGGIESDPHRFETMAQAIAGISLDAGPVEHAATSSAETGLRPAFQGSEPTVAPAALRVEVMDPHDLWDARDAGLRGVVERAAPAMIEAAAPVVAGAVMQQVADRMPGANVRSAAPLPSAEPVLRQVERTTLQLGAFASPAAAHRAWSRISSGGSSVASLPPLFEAAEVDGRSLTRLKVVVGTDMARVVCRAADAADLGCLRRG